MDDIDKLRAAPHIIGDSPEADRMRELWVRFLDGEIEEEWEFAWVIWFQNQQARRQARLRSAFAESRRGRST